MANVSPNTYSSGFVRQTFFLGLSYRILQGLYVTLEISTAVEETKAGDS